MTDVVDAGAAPAAPETPAAATIEAPVTPPNPVESSGPERAPAVESKPSATVKDAIAKAEAKLKEAPKDAPKPVEAKTEAKPEQKPEPKPRDVTGKFASTKPADPAPAPEQKPAASEQPAKPTQFSEAPKRFSDEAKTHWASAPEPVRAEIHRAVKELETGISQYREVVEPLKPYLQLAQKHGTTISKALDQYIAIERSLVSPDVAQKNAALNDVFQTAGVNPREWAAQLLGQSPDQVANQQDSIIRELRQELAGLKQQIGGVTQNMQQQREQATLQEIHKFAADHPRFEELAEDIAFFMKSGRANDLSEAFELAERLNPAPAASAQAPVIPAPPAAEVQPKGSKSISGSPSPGSSPAARKQPSSSIRKALESAMARAS
jgi:hypothetical protein